MGEGFNVVVGEVRLHASTVTSIASQVRSASGGAQESVGGGVFGEIAEFFASALSSACGELRSVMDSASATVEQVESGLSAVADAYAGVDDNHASLFGLAVPTATGGTTGGTAGGGSGAGSGTGVEGLLA